MTRRHVCFDPSTLLPKASPMHLITSIARASLLVLALSFSFAGCGGGGGEAAASAPPAPRAAAALTTVASLTPGATMTWATAGEKSLALSVLGADGLPAAGAAVRVFTLSRSSPHDGAALDEPVPVSLLDTLVSDAMGRATVTLQWPGHVHELMLVATRGDEQGRAVLAGAASADTVVHLAR